MTQVTFVSDDGKLRVGNQVMAHRGDLASRLGIDPSIVHAIQYDTDTGEGHVEYKPGASRPEVSSDQVGVRIGNALGDKMHSEFGKIVSEIAKEARDSGAVRVNMTVTAESTTATVDNSADLSAGMTIQGSNLFPDGTTIASVDSPTQITLSNPSTESDDNANVTLVKRPDVALVASEAQQKIRDSEFLDFRSHPDFGVDLSS